MKHPTDPYTPDEMSILSGNPEAQAFMLNAATQWTIGQLRAEVRRRFILPLPIAEQLDNLLGGWAASEMGMMQLSTAHRGIMCDAITALRQMDKTIKRRPIEELRQEAFGPGQDSSPYRWVILWGPSGYSNVPWRCAVGRRAGRTEHADGRFIDSDGNDFTDGGEDATHFSELPLDV